MAFNGVLLVGKLRVRANVIHTPGFARCPRITLTLQPRAGCYRAGIMVAAPNVDKAAKIAAGNVTKTLTAA
ncbi:hypothetical protein P3T18_003270 [Paraburkholderia sp. GAS199]|uniref:hypothetical protein n=1 Tax=Paraburkholderia sp. GAS199 TaxID=3035126 RepID=UPI003D222B36